MGAGHRLLLSAAQQKAKEAKPLGMDKGIIGHCARSRELVHVPTITGSPYVDPATDGLHRPGRAVDPQGSMLCGPLLTDLDQTKESRVQFLGVVQIMDRKAKS